jgi:hypothetical protein
VYRIICQSTGKFYVGSALNIWKRIGEHVLALRKKRKCKAFQKDWDRYGEYSFTFQILERAIPKDLLTKEQKWLCLLQPWSLEIGYNTSWKAFNTKNDISYDGKRRMSRSLKEYFSDRANLEKHRKAVLRSYALRRAAGIPLFNRENLRLGFAPFDKGNSYGALTKGILKPQNVERNKRLRWITGMARRRSFCLRGKTSFRSTNRLTTEGKRNRRRKQLVIESQRRRERCLKGEKPFQEKSGRAKGFHVLVPIL